MLSTILVYYIIFTFLFVSISCDILDHQIAKFAYAMIVYIIVILVTFSTTILIILITISFFNKSRIKHFQNVPGKARTNELRRLRNKNIIYKHLDKLINANIKKIGNFQDLITLYMHCFLFQFFNIQTMSNE